MTEDSNDERMIKASVGLELCHAISKQARLDKACLEKAHVRSWQRQCLEGICVRAERKVCHD